MGNEIGNSMGLSQGICPECGFAHPPVQGGCPMKKVESPSGETLNFDTFFRPMKEIMFAQIKMKDIKDSDAFFKWMIVRCTKLAEGYVES
jgi:hypothetical protein